jgi:hypothetical protein
MVQGTSEEPPEPLSANTAPLSIAMISPILLTQQAKRNCLQINTISLYEINKALQEGNEMAQISETVPAEYHKFLPLFSEAEANKLPPYRPYDH